MVDLKKNNNKDWFSANKTQYETALGQMQNLASTTLELMNTHDNIETPSGKKSLMRIYRDVRFSKDKSPYKTHWGGGFKRATPFLRGGYYYHIQPGGESFAGGGFWGPSPKDLLQIRQQISQHAEPLRKIINSKNFKEVFGTMEGEQVKTAPKGFDKEDPNIDLLRYKQFLVGHKFTDKEVCSPDFPQKLSDTFKAMRPFFDYMSEILTTDLNGESLLE